MKKVNVLMATYNGDKYLKEQIDSVNGQENVEVVLNIRDDCSTDNTVNILNEYQSKKLLTWYGGEKLGAKYSFLDLVKKSEEHEYYAYCDQDDIWLPRKLISAIKKIEKYDQDIPILYYSKTVQVDENLNKLSKQSSQSSEYSFGQILIKNCASGCTMVFNNALCKLLKMTTRDTLKYIPYHDHWTYLVCISCGGKVIYDSKAYILYRQHGDNVIGANRGIIRRLKENGILNHECRRYLYSCDLYNNYLEYFTPENKKIIMEIIHYKENARNKLTLALDNRVKPINLIEKIIIFLMILLGRF